MERFLFKLKLQLKPLLHSLIQIAFLIFFGWLEDKLFEMAIIWCCFFIFRSTFEKQFHATSTWLCTLYSVAVFYLISLIAPSKAISLLLIITFTFIINIVSFHLREYLDLRVKFAPFDKLEIKKGMSKSDMQSICNICKLTELETSILISFYCDRKSIQNIAIKHNYSYDRIWQIKSEALTKIKNKIK